MYTNTNQKKKIKKIPLIIASKRIKYLATNLIKDIRPVVRKLESTDKETKEKTNNQKNYSTLRHWNNEELKFPLQTKPSTNTLTEITK